MNTLDAIMIAEGEKEATFDESIIAWQHLIDTGVVWKLQGVFGRTAKDLIESGLCTLQSFGQMVLPYSCDRKLLTRRMR